MILKRDIVTHDFPQKLDNGTTIWEFSKLVKGTEIGKNCMIGKGCYVGGEGAVIGDNVKIQNGNNIWKGVTIEDDVFIGPACNLTNHHDPSDRSGDFEPDKTLIKKGATLSTNVTIVAPCTIGENALIGAGALILRDIEDGEKVNWLTK
jgi:acetyltransferase-like isoleucine patch superfamily enzyme